MSQNTKITIITITFNSEKTIEKTVESVIAQNYENLEYWIIDGASEDETINIIEKYSSKYDFIHCISEPDNGISDAFNKGIKKSTGELIGIINSDDQLYKGALIAVDEQYRKTKADVIYGDTVVKDTDNGLVLFKKAGNPEQLKYEMPFIHQSCFIKKEVYEQCGLYSNELKICMDYDMLARIFAKGFTFSNTYRVLSIFEYGGTSCKHPIITINEDMRVAAKYGLGKLGVFKYKAKHIPINIIKAALSRLNVWGALYRIMKKGSIWEEE